MAKPKVKTKVRSSKAYRQAVSDLEEAANARRTHAAAEWPANIAQCPDCGATLEIRPTGDPHRFVLVHIKHGS